MPSFCLRIVLLCSLAESFVVWAELISSFWMCIFECGSEFSVMITDCVLLGSSVLMFVISLEFSLWFLPSSLPSGCEVYAS